MPEKREPLRRCFSCSTQRNKKELLKIIRNLDGNPEIDLDYNKCGRGAYICKNEECFKIALKKKRLDKALKVPVSQEFYEKIGKYIMQDKIYGLLGLCAKSGKLSFGTEAVLDKISKHKVKLVIIAEDTSEKSKEKFINICSKNNIDYYIFGTINSNSKAIGRDNKSIIAVEDINFASAIKNKLEQR